MQQHSATAVMAAPRPGSAAARLSVVVVVHPDDAWPAFTVPAGARVTTDPDEVRATDDVVVLAGRDGGRRCAQLAAGTPPVLVIAPAPDLSDVRVALDHGATGYLVESECPASLERTIMATAAGVTWLGPVAASALISRVRTARRPAPPAGWADLTPRERQIMDLAADGHAPREIATRLRLRTKTVRNNLSNVYAKLQVRNLSEAIIVWLGRDRP